MKSANTVLSSFGTTIFEVMSRLAIEHRSVNLGQGFPDGNGPDDVRAVARAALDDVPNQYPPMMGVPALRQAIAAHDKRFYDIDVDWQRETIVASGATEVLAAALFGLLDKGDEIVMFEPLYDSYIPIARLAGATVKLVRLQPPDWRVPLDELAAAFGPKTKAILINSPLNPAGKVFTRAELEAVAALVRQHDTYAICDEVYEHIVFDGLQHLRLASLDGMWERTVTLSSAGKTFSVTGWKIGWIVAPAPLCGAIIRIHQWIPFSVATPMQAAVCQALVEAPGRDYYGWMRRMYQDKRDRLVKILAATPLKPLVPGGTYFIVADTSALAGEFADDVAVCRYLTTEIGVAAIPPGAFYSEPHKHLARHHARFCFCKEDATLDAAAERLARLL